METDVAECGHILSVGPLEAILDSTAALPPTRAKGSFLPFAQLMDLFDQYPVTVGCGHPFRAPGHVPEQPVEQLKRLSFLDLNGKDIALDRARTERLTYALAEKLELPGHLRQRHPSGGAVRLHQHRAGTGLHHLR